MEQYIRKDCDDGILTDIDEIQYYKATQREEIISNFMLGDYNADGNYIIDESVVDELVRMPKSVTNSFYNMIFCMSLVVTEFVEQEKFVVKTVTDENNPKIKISTLEVMENVNKVEGCIVNTVTTPIAQFIDVDNESYQEKMYDAFNIRDASEFAVEDLEKFSKGLVNLRRKYVVAINHLSKVHLSDVAKKAYLEKMEILKNSGKIGQDAIKSFEERLKKNPFIATQNNYKALNELIDAVIETHKEKLEPIMPQIKQVGIEYAEKVERIEKHANQNLINLQKTEAGKIAIQTQQSIVSKNAITKTQPVKETVTQEAVNAKYKSQSFESVVLEETTVKEQPKEKTSNVFKAIFGALMPENKTKVQKTENKKDAVIKDKLTKEEQSSKVKTSNKSETKVSSNKTEILNKKKTDLKNKNKQEKPVENKSKEVTEKNKVSEKPAEKPVEKQSAEKTEKKVEENSKSKEPVKKSQEKHSENKEVFDSQTEVKKSDKKINKNSEKLFNNDDNNNKNIEQSTEKQSSVNHQEKVATSNSNKKGIKEQILSDLANAKNAQNQKYEKIEDSLNKEVKERNDSIALQQATKQNDNKISIDETSSKTNKSHPIDYKQLLQQQEEEGNKNLMINAVNETFTTNNAELSQKAFKENIDAMLGQTTTAAFKERDDQLLGQVEINAEKEKGQLAQNQSNTTQKPKEIEQER